MNKNMKPLLSGILYFTVAFLSLYILNPEVDIYTILIGSLVATIITLLLFWGASIYVRRQRQAEKS